MATALVADPGLEQELGPNAAPQSTKDGIPTFWVDRNEVHEAVRRIRFDVPQPFKMIYDLTAIDERARQFKNGQPSKDFTVVYHLFSYDRNAFVRLKVALDGDRPSVPSISDICPAANWYEREAWDMF